MKKGFTLIELIIVIVIVGIISAVGAHFVIYLLQNSVYAASKLNTDMAASDAMEIMIDGDAAVKGLRYSKEIRSIINSGGLEGMTFLNQDDVLVFYLVSQNNLFRLTDSGGGWTPAEYIPYYQYPAVSIFGKNGNMFTYYDQNDAATSVPGNVRRIEIKLMAQTGSGDFQQWEAQTELNSSVTVKKWTP